MQKRTKSKKIQVLYVVQRIFSSQKKTEFNYYSQFIFFQRKKLSWTPKGGHGNINMHTLFSVLEGPEGRLCSRLSPSECIFVVVVHTYSKYFDYQVKFLLFAPMSHSCRIRFSIINSYAPLQYISWYVIIQVYRGIIYLGPYMYL